MQKAVAKCAHDASIGDSNIVIGQPGYSIEIVGIKEDNAAIHLAIRGSEAPNALVKALCSSLKCRALDTSSGEFMEGDFSENSFGEWKDYRNRVIGGNNVDDR